MAEQITIWEAVIDTGKYISGLTAMVKKQNELKKVLFDSEREGTEAYKKIEVAARRAGKTVEEFARETRDEFGRNQKTLAEFRKGLRDTGIAAKDSYRALNKELVDLRNAFKNASREEREGDFGKETIARINVLDSELKELDQTIGLSQRNVGDYEKSIIKALAQFGNVPAAEARVKSLNVALDKSTQEVKDLERALDKARKNGSDDIEALERQFIDAAQANNKLQSEVKQSEKAIADLNKKGTNTGSIFKGAFAAFGAIELLRQLGRVAKQTVELGLRAEGVERAFDRINDPTILDELRNAVEGTIDDAELKRLTVVADNFGIAIQQLPRLLEFAKIRAEETGQDVGKLLEDIITGIARESVLIIDNLGISATAVRAEIEKTGDFATGVFNIVGQELDKVGDSSVVTANKLERVGNFFKNLQQSIGTGFRNLIDDIIPDQNESDNVAKLQLQFNSLIRTIERGNVTEQERNKLIDAANRLIPKKRRSKYCLWRFYR